MSISSRFAVGVHILTLLAQDENGQLTSELIAGSVNTNAVVIRRILGDLRRAGLVTAQPGVNGGSRLGRSADQITLLDVYRAVEENHLFTLHPAPNPACQVGRNIQGILETTFAQAEEAMFQSLARVMVSDILQNVLGTNQVTAQIESNIKELCTKS